MCDTQIWTAATGIWFAKNSDRESGEPKPVIRLRLAFPNGRAGRFWRRQSRLDGID